MTAEEIRIQLIDFAHARFTAIVERFLPDLVLPGYFAGHRCNNHNAVEFAYVAAQLHGLGRERVGRYSGMEAIAAWLRQVDGRVTETFFSYRVAETLLEFGKFEGNPLLDDFSAEAKENLRNAVDSTLIFDPQGRCLRGYSNNYWAVLARCEFDRQRLGLLEDDSILKLAQERTQELLFRNPEGFFDDSPELSQRFDIYSADTHLFLEPLWHLYDQEKLEFNLRQHVRLLETIAMKNGGSFAWGRSIGALSVCMTMELCAMSLRLGMAADSERTLGLLAHASKALSLWFSDDLINAHRGAMTDAYRGPYRLLQMTLDCLGKVCLVAEALKKVTGTAADAATLFRAEDQLIPFSNKGAGVWMFRNEQIEFQFPLVGWEQADYAPWFHAPGLLETPVDSRMICGLPRISKGGLEFLGAALPEEVKKIPNGLRLVFGDFRSCKSEDQSIPLGGRRTVSYRVENDTIFAEELWEFDQLPDAISFNVPETDRRLLFKAGSESHHDIVEVRGMPEWRSCWGELCRLHQVQFVPSKKIRFSWSLAPVLRVADVPASHDYNRALYDAMPSGEVIEKRTENCGDLRQATIKELVGENDIFHVGWPEYLFPRGDFSDKEYDDRVLDLIEQLGRSPARIVWTMHNRRPHWWDAERGKALYRAWAQIADGVIHHSQWGMDLIRSELPYNPDAKHLIIPHGHFGAQMPRTCPRDEIEAEFGIQPCVMRFGVLGRWQPEKQVEMIVSAFQAAGRPDQQLLVTAYKGGSPNPDDPRIIFLPRESWLTRELIARHVQLCDVLVSAHVGDTFLTSGAPADAVGAGIPMIVPRWEFFLETMVKAAIYFDNTESALSELFKSITASDIARAQSFIEGLQSRYAWPILAQKTLAFYRRLTGGRGVNSPSRVVAPNIHPRNAPSQNA